MLFRFVIQIQNDVHNWGRFFPDNADDAEEPENFMSFYGMYERTDFQQTLALVYFSFTTLSTVGFGDYNPRSDIERAFMSMGLLFGVIIFSVIMGKYNEIIDKIKAFKETADDSGELSRFFVILQRFNKYKPFPPGEKSKIEAYFNHRWENHKNTLLYDDCVG